MANPLIVSPTTCQGLSWFPPVDVRFAAGEPLIPLHAGELSNAAATMPLAAVKVERQWRLVGVCGTSQGHNLFVRDGKWLGVYTPQWLKTWPLEIVEIGEKGVLSIDRDSGVLGSGDDHGEAFFDDAGRPQAGLAEKAERLKANFPRQRATQKALDALAQAGVFTPWPESVTAPLGLTLDGLHMIDERALANLSDEAYLTLRRAQALPIAYALNLSLAQTHLLTRLSRVNAPAGEPPENLDHVFGEDDDDLTFDFDS
ncbi:SapC family protein [Halomonas sp. HMF6819]|uniref:SapC family protein n=1 Tax=Halomonas sp. HMF6819 TaxID=3373085 RepID=UPI0037999D4E